MAHARQVDVLVAGAGPTGLTAANLLVRHGLTVRVIDQKDGPSLESRALAVHARTLELFERLDLAERLVDAGLPVRGISLFAGSEPLGRLEVEIVDTRYPFILSLPQSDTERHLVACLDNQGAAVEWNTRLLAVEIKGARAVATLESPTGDREQIEVPWLLGCDGAHSIVRAQLGIPFAGTREPEQFFLADVKAREGEVQPQACAFLSSQGTLAVLPLPSPQTIRIIAPQLEQPLVGDARLSTADIEQLVFERSGRRMRLEEPIWQSTFTISRRIVDRYRLGPVFLLGDAAHIHSPVGGQGMNVGIQDAFNLIWKLALVHKGHAHAMLLDSYDSERRPVGQETLRSTRLATRFVVLQNSVARSIRNALVRQLVGIAWLQRRLVRGLSMLDVNYRGSSIVEDHADHQRRLPSWPLGDARGPARIHAGDRAGDFEIASTGAPSSHSRLFDLLRSPRHVLLWFPGELTGADEVASALAVVVGPYRETCETHVILAGSTGIARQPHGWPTWLDASGEGYAHHCPNGARIVLIRPDGYLAWRGGPADIAKLGVFLSRIFAVDAK